MFNGEERVTISTDLTKEGFEEAVHDALDSLGEIDISERGGIAIFPKTSMVSFFSTVTMAGQIRTTDDGFKVYVQYSISPSSACWILAVLLFLFLCMIGGGIIFAPLVMDKPNVARSVENALRDLKHSSGTRKRPG